MSTLSAWLSGIPARISALKWPDGESELSAPSDHEGTAVLDGRVVRWRAFVTDPDTPSSVVHAADATRDLPVFERVATLDYAADRLEIVAEIGFATVEWRAHESVVILRSHLMSGEKQQETSVHAQAAYGQLSVCGTSVALCVCSGNASEEWAELAGNMFADEIGYVGTPEDGFEDRVGHEIIVWDADSGSVKHCPIPQDAECIMNHSAEFELLTLDKVVLAGSSDEFSDVPILKCFPSAAGEDDKPIAFTTGEVTEEMVSDIVGHPGSTEPSTIVVHDHGPWRISVFRRELFEGSVPTSSSSEDPPGLCQTFAHPDHVRTVRGSVSRPACVAGDRVLVQGGSYFEPSFHVLDFNQARLSEMLSKSDSERDRLRNELQRAGARVRVVTRWWFMTEDGEFDQEYRNPSVAIAPPELREHVKGLQGRKNDALVYDEWPQEPRDPTRWGFVKTELPVLDRPMTSVAISRGCIIEIPKTGEEGRVLYFE